MKGTLRAAALLTLSVLTGTIVPGAMAQESNEDISPAEKAYVASRIYSSVQSYFAHWTNGGPAKFEASYKAYLNTIFTLADRRAFDFATMEWVASLQNKHTQFDDEWLRADDGASPEFGVT